MVNESGSALMALLLCHATATHNKLVLPWSNAIGHGQATVSTKKLPTGAGWTGFVFLWERYYLYRAALWD